MSFDALRWACELELPANEKNVIVQLAYRHNRETGQCNPSLDRIAKDTGLSKSTVCNALKGLTSRGLLHRSQRFHEGAQTRTDYRLSLETMPVHDADTAVSQEDTPVHDTDNPCPPAGLPLSATRTQTRNKNKEVEQGKTTSPKHPQKNSNNQDDPSSVQLPEWLKREDAEAFFDMRKRIKKKPLTAYAWKRIIAKLERCYDTGNDAVECLQNSIVNCWQDVFTDKAKPRKREFVPFTSEEDIWPEFYEKESVQ